jgi:hypothetical protein
MHSALALAVASSGLMVVGLASWWLFTRLGHRRSATA